MMLYRKTKLAVGGVALALVLLVAGIWIGTRLGQDESVSFYAKVIANQGSALLVRGISENDVNHRSEFIVSLRDPGDKKAVLNASGASVPLSSLPSGTEVKITYGGAVLDSYPAQIRGATKIQVIS